MRRKILYKGTITIALFVSMMGFVGSSHAAPGDLDTSFDPVGHDGIVTTKLDAHSAASYGVVIQSDGKIVVAGSVIIETGNPYSVAVVRYNPDGSLDTTFGSGQGFVTTAPTPTTYYARAVALQQDGKIVAAGYGAGDFLVVRYNTDGSLDTGFGNAGIVTTDIGGGNSDYAYAVAIQSDGKIVAAGVKDRGMADPDIAVVRYDTLGDLDASFNGTGKVTIPISSTNEEAYGVAIQPDGKIVVAGSQSSPYFFIVARLNADGTQDATFGTDGIVKTDFGQGDNEAYAMLLQPDGKILAGGYANISFGLARYNGDNGDLDATFGSGGEVMTQLGTFFDSIAALALQPDGKIVAAGESRQTSATAFALVRYNADGSLDAGFGNGGKVLTDISPGYDSISGVALQSDGAIVVAGNSYDGSTTKIVVARYIGMLADLQIAMTTSSDTVVSGNDLTYTVTVTNNGPDATYDVVVTDTLPAEVDFVSSTPSQGTCTGTDIVTCNLGSLGSGANASISIIVTPGSAGSIVNNAAVTGRITDTDPSNNSSELTTTVSPQDLGSGGGGGSSDGGGCTLIP